MRLVVVHHPERGPETAAALAGLTGAASALPPILVPGGATRTASVRAGLAALPADVTVVAVHDAARPLVPVAVVEAAIAAVVGDVVASAPALPLADTVKRVDPDGRVTTVEREGLRTVQTPQVVRRDVLERALADGDAATDELVPVERLLADGGTTGRIALVEGSPLAHKVTYRHDLALLEALARAEDG